MYLYHLTLQRSKGIVHCAYGNFSGAKAHELIIAREKSLELLRPDDSGRLQSVLAVEIFGKCRTLAPFRLTGDTKDYIVVGTDSGRIVILQYNKDKHCFDKIHEETFGKSGCRRIVPGQYLAVDPKGRAVMIASIEKQKLVYILNRDTSAKLTISSPLEAHKGHSILFSVVGVDVGYENPLFACLELDYGSSEHDSTAEHLAALNKQLTYYELDLGLNHVVRKWSETVDMSANLLITVPGGGDGPGGVLVCSEGYIKYRHINHAKIEAAIPRRADLPASRSVLIIAHATHRQKGSFFFVVQSEYGDLYKMTLDYVDETVSAIRIHYLETLPAPANALAVTRTGFLFVASEFGDHYFYQFQRSEEGSQLQEKQVTFVPKHNKNLLLMDQLESLCPILGATVKDIYNEDTPQILAICGRGASSKLRTLRFGLEVTEMAVNELLGIVSNIWSLPASLKDQYDKYMIVSFSNATKVLSIGENIVEITEAECGFSFSTATLCAALLATDALVQVHPNGIRYIRSAEQRIEWKAPGKRTIVHATANARQLAVALSGGDIVYFEVDMTTGQLMEIEKYSLGHEIACLDIAPVPPGRQRGQFLAVGDWDLTVRILSLNPQHRFTQLSVQTTSSQPESLCIMEQLSYASDSAGGYTSLLYLSIGLHDGVLLRTVLDEVTGEMTDTRRRFLGSRPVRLAKLKLPTIFSSGGAASSNTSGLASASESAMIALSSRSWLCFNSTAQQRFVMTPLSFQPLDCAANFCSPECTQGIVATSGDSLRILTLEKLGDTLKREEVPLQYTPRSFITLQDSMLAIIIESDHNAMHASQLKAYPVDEESMADENEAVMPPIAPTNRSGKGKWASCIRVHDLSSASTIQVIELDNNESAFSIASCTFNSRKGETFVVVGTGKDVSLLPRSCSGGYIHIYQVIDSKLQFLHKTEVDGMPGAVAPFHGRLLAGVGNVLRIYDLGKKKLLRKTEKKGFPTLIRSIKTIGTRIYVGDLAESFHFLEYKKADNEMYLFADDTNPRWLTAHEMLDYDTCAGADKFGNIFISRLPTEVSNEIEADPTGSKLKLQQGLMQGAPHKLQDVATIHIGEQVTSLVKTCLVPGGNEILLYSTLMGGVGALLPFMSREDVDFFQNLEMHMRQERPPLCGRDHLAFRSFYFPLKNIIDGDLCEQFTTITYSKQKKISEDLTRSPSEVLKKIEDIRNMII